MSSKRPDCPTAGSAHNPDRGNRSMSPAGSDIVAQLQTEWTHLLNQSVDRIQHCVNQLSAEQIWWQPAEDQNSIGMLMQHLSGNLQQWVVDGVTQEANSRDRNAEFEATSRIPGEQLQAKLCRVVSAAMDVLRGLSRRDLTQMLQIQGFDVTVMGAIMHSVPHFVGHTHQIVQLTRLQLNNQYQFHWDPEGPRDVVPL